MKKSKGILYISLSAFFFSLMAVAVKATPNIPVVEKIFFRNMIGLVPILINSYRSQTSLKPNNTKLIILRSTFGLLGIFAYYTALSLLSLSDAVIMNKLSPFFVLVFSAIFLKEKIKNKQIYALIFAVTGALFVIKPSFDLSVIPALIGLSSAIFAGAAYTTVRKLSESDAPIVIVFYFSLITTLITIPVMIVTKNFVIPTGTEALLLILIGLAAVTAQIFMTSAYRYAPAGELAIYTYSNIVFSIIFSIVIWSDFPDLYSLMGAFLIVTGGYINYKVKKKRL
ncbi:MAG TPA: DMT family transporter [Clostridia bacterium]|nr:DMT family transporter [Clostridia bacterium]